ncbi:XRE family transcriptional regulator [Nostocoides vanveenii]|uniref:XRE family transcriptional regulator n=1 Tax=Nostocoides vanveenii TaxID=330835 RepID=A0ABN2KTU3_9MICO
MPERTSTRAGRQIRLRREQRGLSAAELARRAGLSKATLSGLESGTGNPTIDTLEAIALALALSLTDLLSPEAPDTVHVLATAIDGDIQCELLVRVRGTHALESWRLRIPRHTSFSGVPHASGTIEQLFIAFGAVRAELEDAAYDLAAGDLLSFAADVPHAYITADEPVDIHVLLATPSR